MPKVTKTTIIFNDKLKEVVSQVRRENWGLVNILGEVDACIRDGEINANRGIREAFDVHIGRLDFNHPQTSFKKQDYFVLFMCVISSRLDEINKWEELIAKSDIRGVEVILRAQDCTCCCGQPIKDICMMISDNSGCIVGNCCVQKNLISNPACNPSLVEKFKAIKKHQKDAKKAFELEQEKEQKLQLIVDFKLQNPTKCYGCNKGCKKEYQFCYGCNAIKKGMVLCKEGCGNYHDKKYKKCFKCIKAV
jgi:hypothetical protein